MGIEGPAGDVWRHVCSTFTAQGRAPSIGELSAVLGLEGEATRGLLEDLHERHLLVLNGTRDAVRMAHPFSAAPMGFVVTPLDGADERRWWGGCAWDSFGISAALRLDVLIDTTCPACARHLRVEAGPDRPPDADLFVRYPRPAREWWSDVVATCSAIRMFCNGAHAEGWMWRTGSGGRLVRAATVWSLAQTWYGDRLSEDYEPHTLEHNQRLLREHGLDGEFWQLPG